MLKGNHEYKVKIVIGDQVVMETDKPKQHKDRYCRWHERLKKNEFEFEYTSVDQMGMVYIYLMKDNKPISYQRVKASKFKSMNAQN